MVSASWPSGVMEVIVFMWHLGPILLLVELRGLTLAPRLPAHSTPAEALTELEPWACRLVATALPLEGLTSAAASPALTPGLLSCRHSSQFSVCL